MPFMFETTVNSAFGGRPHVDVTVDRERTLKRLQLFASFLDDAIQLPGTRFSIGWDGLIGLVPGIGDALTTLLSGYFLWEANRLGVSKSTQWRMLANILIDMLVGAVPVLGDLFDFTWKANRRNLNLLLRELGKGWGSSRGELARPA
jgi:hypothetical protein